MSRLGKLAWTKMFGILDQAVVEVEAYPVEGGYIVRRGCYRQFVEAEKLSSTRAEAETRLRALGERKDETL